MTNEPQNKSSNEHMYDLKKIARINYEVNISSMYVSFISIEY